METAAVAEQLEAPSDGQKFVSSCGGGVRRLPTQYDVRKRDSTQRDNLHVIILLPGGLAG
jgi:hypothetical protein